MRFDFTKQGVRKKQDIYLLCDPPPATHPPRTGWLNLGIETYVEQFGQDDFDRFSRNDFAMPMPDDTPSERKQLRRTVRKAKLMFGFKALLTGRRTTHMRGIGTRGTIEIVDKPSFPDHEFFQAGKTFPCRMRHANASFYDDASIQVRSCSLKFADADFESPLDVLMNSGPTSAFWDLKSFMDFSIARSRSSEHDWEAEKQWMRQSPAGYIGTIDAVRHAPESYTAMSYYSKIAFPFKARDGRTRYAKFRILPADLREESGLMSIDMQRQPWVQCRQPDDTRPEDYLRHEYRERLANEKTIEYSLQIQVRDWDVESDTFEFFNMNRLWDESSWPWLDLARVRIREVLPAEVSERMGMWLGHQPPSLGLTDAHSPVDYRSLCWARPQVYPVSRRNRSVLRFLGLTRQMRKEF